MNRRLLRLVFVFCCVYLVSLGAEENWRQKFASIRSGEEAEYEVIVSSNTGSNRSTMVLQVTSVGSRRVRVKKTVLWRGKKKVKLVRLNRRQDIVQFLEEELRSKWENPQISKQVSSSPETVDLERDVEVLVQKRGMGTKQLSTSTETSFSCYKITLKVKGLYPRGERRSVAKLIKKRPKPSEMKMTYWISPDVPVLGWVKVEGEISRKVSDNLTVKGKVKIVLRRYKKIQ